MLIPSRSSTGYMLPTETNPMIGAGSFGHTEQGGSLGFADLDHGIAFGYAMNKIIEEATTYVRPRWSTRYEGRSRSPARLRVRSTQPRNS
ncbi:hypothetical protein [Streptomyces sp. NPDC048225]|uniref:hypothetical protein n=1 Tax=Streptomyces sp. NPDC048225 TaxID=3365518 RepID=UPI0037102887